MYYSFYSKKIIPYHFFNFLIFSEIVSEIKKYRTKKLFLIDKRKKKFNLERVKMQELRARLIIPNNKYRFLIKAEDTSRAV